MLLSLTLGWKTDFLTQYPEIPRTYRKLETLILSILHHCMCASGWHSDTGVLQNLYTNTQEPQHTKIKAYLTSKTIRHICFKHNVAENGGKRERFVALIPKGDVSVTCLQPIQRQDPLTNQLIIVIIHCYSQDSKIREDNLESHKMQTFNDTDRAAPSLPPVCELWMPETIITERSGCSLQTPLFKINLS